MNKFETTLTKSALLFPTFFILPENSCLSGYMLTKGSPKNITFGSGGSCLFRLITISFFNTN